MIQIKFCDNVTKVEPGSVVVFTMKTSEVDLQTGVQAAIQVQKQLMKQGVFGIFIPDFFNIEETESFDDALETMKEKIQGFQNLYRQIQEKKEQFEKKGKLKYE